MKSGITKSIQPKGMFARGLQMLLAEPSTHKYPAPAVEAKKNAARKKPKKSPFIQMSAGHGD